MIIDGEMSANTVNGEWVSYYLPRSGGNKKFYEYVKHALGK